MFLLTASALEPPWHPRSAVSFQLHYTKIGGSADLGILSSKKFRLKQALALKQFARPDKPGIGQELFLQEPYARGILRCLEPRRDRIDEALPGFRGEREIAEKQSVFLAECLNGVDQRPRRHEDRPADITRLPFHPVRLGSADDLVALALVRYGRRVVAEERARFCVHVEHELVEMDVSPFMSERGAKAILHVGRVKSVRDLDDGALARREFRHAFDLAFLFREVGVGIEVRFLLDEYRKIVGPDRKFGFAVFLRQELYDDALALFIEFLGQIVRPPGKPSRPVLDPFHGLFLHRLSESSERLLHLVRVRGGHLLHVLRYRSGGKA